MTRPVLALTGLAALAAAFGLGRLTAPKPVAVKETASKLHSKTDEVKTFTSREVTVANVSGVTKWRERVVYVPTGEIRVEREGERSDAAQTKTDATKAQEVRVETKTVVETKYVERAPLPLPRWAVGASYSAALDGRMGVGADVGVRLFGPVWATGGVDLATKAGRIGIRVTF